MIRKIVFLNIHLQTGGPENIHQVCDVLRRNGYDAKILYADGNPEHPDKFKKYNNEVVTQLSADNETLFVFPEFLAASTFKSLQCKKALWWLSVDNSPDKNRQDLKSYLQENGIDFCFAQCEYIRAFLASKGISNIVQVPDHIADVYLQPISSVSGRNPWVLFNPKKGLEFTAKIIEQCKDITFVPIQNMTTDEVMHLMDRSMAYIDFGNHPGKDRIPREAASRGLVVLTSKFGSAANEIDVQIPSQFKIDAVDANLALIHDTLRTAVDQFEDVSRLFHPYREKIIAESADFEANVLKAFRNIIL